MNEQNPERLVCVWQTSLCPLSYDIILFLAYANIISKELGLGGFFHVLVIKNGFRNIGIESEYSQFHQERKFRNVIIQTLTLCKWVQDFQVCSASRPLLTRRDIVFPSPESRDKLKGRPEWMITPMTSGQLEGLYNSGKKNTEFGFTPSTDLRENYKIKFGEKALLLQARQSKFTSARNVPVPLFESLVIFLVERGLDVFYIPDCENPDGLKSLEKFGAVPVLEAAFDYEIRLACSHAVLCNVIWNGGFAAPLQFTEATCCFFGNVNEEVQISSRSFFERKGPSFGKLPPWLDPKKHFWDWRPVQEVDLGHLMTNIQRFVNI